MTARALLAVAACSAVACHDFNAELEKCIQRGKCADIAAEPDLVVDVEPFSGLDFGSVTVGVASSLTLPLKNAGGAKTGVIESSLSGSAFRVLSDGCTGKALESLETCALMVEASATQPGALSGNLSITASPGGMLTIPLTGQGDTPASLAWSPASFDFGRRNVGSAPSPAQTLTVRNSGTRPANGVSVSVTGDDGGSFQLTGSCGPTLLVDCTVDLRFQALAVGMVQASLEARGDNGLVATAALRGEGVASTMEVLPPLTDFGPLVLGSSAGPVQLSVRNGGAAITGPLSVRLTLPDAGFFLGANNLCNGVTLNPSATCTFTVGFTPAQPGPVNTQVEVSATPGGVALADVTGIGWRPALLSAMPTMIDFGAVDAGAEGFATATIKNGGDQPSGAVSFTALPAGFNVASTTCDGGLDGQASCTANVRFAPVAYERRNAQLRASATPGGQATVDLTGLGIGDVPLTVSVTGPGSGWVLGPGGLSCPGTCMTQVTGGTPVTLTAVADAGSAVTWTAGACSGTNPVCNFVPDGGVTATARFELTHVPVTVTVIGAGSGWVLGPGGLSCPGTCTSQVMRGTPFSLTAVADAGSTVTWTAGACSGTNPVCNVVSDAGVTATARFDLLNFRLTVDAGRGGDLLFDGGTPVCAAGRACQLTYPYGTVVNLFARPKPTWNVASWNGGCSGSATGCQLAITQDRFVGVDFDGGTNFAFVTSTTQTGPQIGGLAGADSRCNQLAQAANLPGTYRAYLGTVATGRPTNRLVGASGWVRTDGRPIAQTVGDLDAGILVHPVVLKEDGGRSGASGVWTGLGGGGQLGSDCQAWTDGGSSFADYGDPSFVSEEWSSYSGANCSASSLSVYCFGVDKAGNIPPPPGGPGRRAFVTPQTFAPNQIPSTHDQICQGAAAAAGLSGTFAALRSSGGSGIGSSFAQDGGNWYRLDGWPVFYDPLDMRGTAPRLAAPVVIAPGGARVTGEVWTGSGTGPGAAPAATCQSWSSVSNTQSGGFGLGSSDLFWWSNGTKGCNLYSRLYCFER